MPRPELTVEWAFSSIVLRTCFRKTTSTPRSRSLWRASAVPATISVSGAPMPTMAADLPLDSRRRCFASRTTQTRPLTKMPIWGQSFTRWRMF